MFCLVDDNIVDGGFGSRTGCCRQRNDWHGLLLCVCNPLKRNHVGKLGVVAYNAYALGGIHGRASTDGYDEIGPGLLACLDTILDICYCRVRLHVIVNGIGNGGLVENVENHLCHTELHKSLVCYDKSFLEAETLYYSRQLLACARTKIRHFV